MAKKNATGKDNLAKGKKAAKGTADQVEDVATNAGDALTNDSDMATGIRAAGGAAAGAAAGSLLGPLGAAVGAVIGGAFGTTAGDGEGEEDTESGIKKQKPAKGAAAKKTSKSGAKKKPAKRSK